MIPADAPERVGRRVLVSADAARAGYFRELISPHDRPVLAVPLRESLEELDPIGRGVDHQLDPCAHADVGRGALVTAALEARGAPRCVLSTAEKNESAQRLFARAGFRRTMIEMTRELEGDV